MIAKLRQNSNIRKAVVIVGLVTMLAGLFGCTEKPGREPIHDTSEVRLVSIGCGHMDYSCCYDFMLKRSDEDGEIQVPDQGAEWLFEGGCFLRGEEERTEFEPTAVRNQSAETLLEIIKSNGIITYVENYKNPKKLNVHVLDETTYSFCIEFSDGQRYIVGNMVPGQWELEDYFYNLGKELKNGTD